MKPAIRVDNLSKQYRLGARQGDGYLTLRESLMRAARKPFQRLGALARRCAPADSPDTFWALKDVSFEVQPGEVVGIIGRNGAGKSTLLKILSRIVEPSSGRAELRGRIGSLLEVGTGFHPELTGRENIYMNGAILGMTRREINQKFHEIVAFAEIEQFLDTPVKRYSSGMYIRLAFAVAANLNLETLLVDEVLAVGDASYQRRCIEKMNQLATSGATIIFVSHSMDMIPRLCHRALLLRQGQIANDGSATAVVSDYVEMLTRETCEGDLRTVHRTGDGRAHFSRIQLIDAAGNAINRHISGDNLRLRIEVQSIENVDKVELAVVLENLHGTRLITSWTKETNFPINLRHGIQVFTCQFQQVRIRPGHRIAVGLWMSAQKVIDCVNQSLVLETDAGKTTSHFSTDSAQGVLALDSQWEQVSIG